MKVLELQVMLISEVDAESWEGFVGRLSHDKLSDLLTGLNLRQTVALICGPGPMVTAVSDALLDLGLPMNKIIYERFDYAGGASRQDRRGVLKFLTTAAALAAAISVFEMFQ